MEVGVEGIATERSIADMDMVSAARRNQSNWPLRRKAGLVLLVSGAVLVLFNGIYFAYTFYASNQVGNVVANTPLRIPAGDDSLNLEETSDKIRSVINSSDVNIMPTEELFQDLSTLYPGIRIDPLDWDRPRWAESIVPEPMPSGYQPVSLEELSGQRTASPTRIRIPAIYLDADVQGLEILNLGDERQYETPKHVVGHIPESANPGMPNNAWLFGHLQSPIRNEGAVFRDLPEVYDLLREGEDVYIILDSADGSFLYQARRFTTIPEEDLTLWDTGTPTITLVTCWPPFKYDDRILVEAELVGVNLN